jgi:hypothetical protein
LDGGEFLFGFLEFPERTLKAGSEFVKVKMKTKIFKTDDFAHRIIAILNLILL